MTLPFKFERGDTTVGLRSNGEVLVLVQGLGVAVVMTAADFRWLILTAGPAVLHRLQALEEDAGTGGGPAPATAEATEPADEPDPEPLALEVEDRADPHSTGCPACQAAPGVACTTPTGLVTRPHAARKKVAAGA